ncbi:hypothetical protein V565_349830 [Rhizoctonia solani 123E]|uniref:Uncharacterized protein n=1 Tax=Rhizoctonia solani 123E TaxID=1423351 RepID=A0A074RCM1_9AGAM|nr:hypothetical protein V565_349830 [Rhizoctonia solani 123E]
MGSASRSNSTASYPDYAPPVYEVVVSMTLPETVPESGILEAMVSEKPDTTTTVQEVESVMSHNPIDPHPHCFNRTPTFDKPPEPLTQPFVVQGKPGKKFLDDAFEIIGTSALHRRSLELIPTYPPADTAGSNWIDMDRLPGSLKRSQNGSQAHISLFEMVGRWLFREHMDNCTAN